MLFKAVVVILVIHLIKLNAVPMRQLPERPIETQNESVTLTPIQAPIKAPTATKTPPFSNVIRMFVKFIKLNKVALPSATFSNRKRLVELAQVE
jgi:hypothetical protein